MKEVGEKDEQFHFSQALTKTYSAPCRRKETQTYVEIIKVDSRDPQTSIDLAIPLFGRGGISEDLNQYQGGESPLTVCANSRHEWEQYEPDSTLHVLVQRGDYVTDVCAP